MLQVVRRLGAAMQGRLYGVSYVDWMLYCKSVVVEVGVGSLVAYSSSERGC